MCGFATVFAYHYAASPVSREELGRISAAMITRGPDGAGEFFSADGRIGMAHRRLAILDLSPNGAQPMVSEDGRLTLCFNGEIYNYPEIRARLEKSGVRFRSRCDTEAILHLYRERGERLAEELIGMFAIALWDADRQRLFLARDPYGIKPLYYADDGWTLRVASQVKALLAGGRVSRAPDPESHVGYFLCGSVPEPGTLYREVRQLPAGSTLSADFSGPSRPRPYFSPAATYHHAQSAASSGTRTETFREARGALRESVRRHLLADVPISVFLSGGIDSAALSGLVRDEGRGDLEAITLAFSEYEGTPEDEGPLARRTSDTLGLRHRIRQLEQDEFERRLPGVFDAMDQPSIDGVNTYFVSLAAKEAGFKVALSGLGADELFGGYPSFDRVPALAASWLRVTRLPGFKEFWRGAIRTVRSGGARGIHPKQAGLSFAGTFAGAYFLQRGLFMPWELGGLLPGELAAEGLRRFDPERRFAEGLLPDPGDAFRRVSTLESTFYMRNQLLRDADWAGMAHSLEIRTPFVDSRLLDQTARLSPIILRQERKALLAGSPSLAVPKEVIERSKRGFTVPIARWLERAPGLDAWRSVPQLRASGCPWARRWAYTVYQRYQGSL